MENGDSSNFKIELDKGFSVTGVFKLDHLQPIGPILLQKIFNFFTFILGGQFLLPKARGLIMGKGSWSLWGEKHGCDTILA